MSDAPARRAALLTGDPPAALVHGRPARPCTSQQAGRRILPGPPERSSGDRAGIFPGMLLTWRGAECVCLRAWYPLS